MRLSTWQRTDSLGDRRNQVGQTGNSLINYTADCSLNTWPSLRLFLISSVWWKPTRTRTDVRLMPRPGGATALQSSTSAASLGRGERRCRTTAPRTTPPGGGGGGRNRLRCQAAGGGGSAQTAAPGTTASAAADSSREAPMSPTGTAAPLPRPPMAKGEVFVSLAACF